MPWWGQALVILGIVVLGIAIVAVTTSAGAGPGIWTKIKAVAGRAVEVARWALGLLRLGIAGIAAAVVVLLAIMFVPPLWSVITSGGACGEPIDLRVVTDAENVGPLGAAARRYMADRSGGGCRTVTVDVTADAPAEQAEAGFAHGWTSPGTGLSPDDCSSRPPRATLLGAQPDVWIPASSIIARGVRDYVEGLRTCSGKASPVLVRAHLDVQGSVASSPLVLGVFPRSDQPSLVSGKQGLKSLLDAFYQDDLVRSLARPSPDASTSGLLATPLLYQVMPGSGGDPAKVEEALAQTEAPAGDAVSMLCELQKGAAAPPDRMAVIVPESVLARYDHGDAPGCPSGRPPQQWRLSAYYANDLPVLDFPFVHVRWPGQDDGRRDEAVADFRKWLQRDALTRDGLRTPSGRLTADDHAVGGLRNGDHSVPDLVPPRPLAGGANCAGPMEELFHCFQNARPPLPLSVMLDVSGSMANPSGPQSEPRLGFAQEMALRIMGGIRPSAPTSLFQFSRPPRSKPDYRMANGGLVAASGGESDRLDVETAVQKATTTGWDLALTSAIAQAAPHLPLGKQTLVLVTDGQAASTNSGAGGQAAALARQIKKDYPELTLLIALTPQSDCRAEPVASIAAAFGPDTCKSADTVDEITSLVAAQIYRSAG
ncbi:substrate-binding domain-containing protein [Actinomadura violacea]|uniref:Substrate-binding domain-containing protein n=1 Tax=Actinomadura violacea TaxID=2819934 RepID=A0ABS3RSP6_9ACTN|nr:substrate-binding domain-containing protein [Actinomadura violacea]MBO2459070.1 substrate-binding domain-containing protein [Actinomadura violacea]